MISISEKLLKIDLFFQKILKFLTDILNKSFIIYNQYFFKYLDKQILNTINKIQINYPRLKFYHRDKSSVYIL